MKNWVKDLLKAGQTTQTALSPRRRRGATAKCFDPRTQNVEDIQCHECKSTWQTTCASHPECAGNVAMCMRAIACDHPDVCDDWKTTCTTSDVPMTNCRTALHPSLLEVSQDGEIHNMQKAIQERANLSSASIRREEQEEGARMHLDSTLQTKCA
jgi:hypothetical protein